jgi:hypothetical protein
LKGGLDCSQVLSRKVGVSPVDSERRSECHVDEDKQVI